MCVFCSIVSGEQPAEIVYSDGSTIAFLDVRPLFVGHTLVVPRAHLETLGDLPSSELPGFFTTVQMLARVVPRALGSPGSFVALNNVVSQSVPHLHVHVVPRRFKDGLKGFFWPRTRYDDPEHMRATGDTIRAAVADEA